MAKQKIIGIYMLTDSGGVGTENRLSYRVERDRVELDDNGPTVKVTVHPPRTTAGTGGKSFYYEVPKSAMRFIEYESPAAAAAREASEAKVKP